MVGKKTRSIYGSRTSNKKIAVKRGGSKSNGPTKPKFNFTPRILFSELSKYVVGQSEAMEKVCNSICYHYRRLSFNNVGDKSNVLLIGPTGCGKTYIMKKVSEILDVPLVVVDATKFVGTGYVGSQVESIIYELYQNANKSAYRASRGMVFIDEIDKIACNNGNGPDVSGRMVQNGLLKIMEDEDVRLSEYTRNVVNTKNILFICSGAFSEIYPFFSEDCNDYSNVEENEILINASHDKIIKALISYGMIPELLGRIPVIAKLNELKSEDIANILRKSKDSPITSYIEDFKSYGISARFSDDSYNKISEIAYKQGVGARGIKSVLEETLSHFKFFLPGSGIKIVDFSSKTFDSPTDYLLDLIDKSR